MREKIYVIAKGLPGQAILKNRAMAGEAVYNWHFMSPSQLASEVRQSYGIRVERPVLSGAEAAFLLYGIMKENEAPGRYFTARSISDVQSSLMAINRLRLQLSSDEGELDGLRRLLKAEEGSALIQRKNDAIIGELAEPYLKALEERGFEDTVTVLRKTIREGKMHELPLMRGRGIFVEERPLAPLEKELAQLCFEMIEIEKENIVLGGNKGTTNTMKKFDSYGASNEVRTIVEAIKNDGKPLDQYLIACGNPSQYAPLFREYEGLNMTLDGGERTGKARVCILAEKLLDWHRNAYTKESFGAMADKLDSQKLRKKMMEDGLDEKESWKVWRTVLELAKNLYFSLDIGENLRRLRAYSNVIETSDEAGADRQRKAIPYCELFAEMMSVEMILKDMVFLRDGDPFELQSYGIFRSLMEDARQFEGVEDIDLLPSVIQLFQTQKAGGASPEPGKVHLCSWNKAHLYRRPVIFLCGLQSLTGSISENAVLLDGDIELVKSRIRDCDLKTTKDQIRERSETFRRIVEYLKDTGTDLTLSWSNYSLNELKALSVPAVLNELEGTMGDRADFTLEQPPKAVATGTASASDPASGNDSLGLGELPLLTVTPSAAEKMLKCPYSFMMTKILGVQEPENEESQTIWLDAAEKGTFCHSVFEQFVHWDRNEETQAMFQTLGADEIKAAKRQKMGELASQILGEWQIRKPHLANMDRTIRELNAILNGFLGLWESFPAGTVEMTEMKIEDRPIVADKLQCHGIPDLVMKFDGKGIAVLDYKTGKEVKHKENDVVSCVQTLLYCMMLSQKEYKGQALSTTYLYPLPQESVSCRYDPAVETVIRQLFTKAIEAMETGDGWLATDGKDGALADPDKNPACAWCKLKGFCTRDMDVEERLFEEEASDDDR
ncbi:MAG: PD-(D/E)XK nuclease family protein [Firmicutes bacterium]|nr:PD-(D/E)XK nuclease family protein [Bacillota bacterium]